jgi:hypothetical protein
MRGRRGWVTTAVAISAAAAVLVGGLGSPPPAFGQTTDRVLAEALFREGRDLMAQDKVSEACGKFAESYRLDRALGTLINLALCHEKEGKTASAWAEFDEAAADAASQKDDREAFAKKHIAALVPELARLRLALSPAASALSTLEIRLDGNVLGKAAWSSPLPIDPGEHELGATADGKRPFSLKFTVAKGPGTTDLVLPALDDAPKPATGPASPPPEDSGRGLRTVGYVVGGVGVAGLVVGGIFGLRAISLKSDRDALCSGDNLCDPSGVTKDRHARDTATVSTIGFIAGGALLAGGVVLVLSAPRASAPSVRVGVSGRGISAGGTF